MSYCKASRLIRYTVAVVLCVAARLNAAPPPDHIVIVVEENHSEIQIIGSPQAPYINALANGGASFTSMFAVTHPSQGNYVQFFSGDNQGIVDDTVPAAGTPFTTPNLAAELLAVGRSFAGYSEDLPTVGSPVSSNGEYMRKHNPWVNWQSASPGVNQLLPALNRPFFTTGGAAFYGDTNAPSDYSTLPTVSFAVPNQLNDMHDGTIAQGDAWIQNYIIPYADWCLNHNSLLIITWDEDDSSTSRNRIATIFYGPMIVPGQYATTWTHHNILRTIEDMYQTAHAGSASHVRPMVGCFNTDGAVATKSFRQGAGGYTDAHDTYIEQTNPSATHGTGTILVADGSPFSQGLIRFDNIIGPGASQVPQGVTVLSAKLLMLTGSTAGDSSTTTSHIHRMLASWSDSSTWNSLVGGVSLDNVEASAAADFTLLPNALNIWAIYDVSDAIQAFANDPTMNHGWVIQPSGTDGWRCASSEAASVNDRPLLEITYDPTSCRASLSQQPLAQHVAVGQTLHLSVGAAGGPPLSYQWKKDNVALFDGGSISGSASPDLYITPAATGDTGIYSVTISNPCGDANSVPATVLVCTPGGDMNGDASTNGDDIQPFVNAVLANSGAAGDVCAADFSFNNSVDPSDVDAFVAALLPS